MVRPLKRLAMQPADTVSIPPEPNPIDVAFGGGGGDKKPPIPAKKYLLDTTLPASPVLILDATIRTTDDRHQLNVQYVTRGTPFHECVLGDSIYDLMHHLTTQLGFDTLDAFKIINRARRLQ